MGLNRCVRKVHLLLVSFLVCIVAVRWQSTVALCNLCLTAVGSICSCIWHTLSPDNGWGKLSGVLNQY